MTPTVIDFDRGGDWRSSDEVLVGCCDAAGIRHWKDAVGIGHWKDVMGIGDWVDVAGMGWWKDVLGIKH